MTYQILNQGSIVHWETAHPRLKDEDRIACLGGRDGSIRDSVHANGIRPLEEQIKGEGTTMILIPRLPPLWREIRCWLIPGSRRSRSKVPIFCQLSSGLLMLMFYPHRSLIFGRICLE